MDRFGIRRVVPCALLLVAAGSGLTVFMTASLAAGPAAGACWSGSAPASMALVFVATVTSRWFVRRRGLVTGVLTAAGATGQLVFLPLLAALAERPRLALAVARRRRRRAGSSSRWSLALLRDRPADVGLAPVRRDRRTPRSPAGRAARAGPAPRRGCSAQRVPRTRAFWLLAGGFAICGATTNGLIGTHFIPAAHDHGMPETTAAGLLALVGLFDIAGTIGSGWLTDRMTRAAAARRLLRAARAVAARAARRSSPAAAPGMLGLHRLLRPGLGGHGAADGRALRRASSAPSGPVVFGWVFASHQLGAAAAASAAGAIRTEVGDYLVAFVSGAALCLVAALITQAIRRPTATAAVAPA